MNPLVAVITTAAAAAATSAVVVIVPCYINSRARVRQVLKKTEKS